MRAHMKYIVVLCDGMADEPLLELDGMTPMEAAKTPNMDRMAQISEIGMVQTIPNGMAPGSDTANLSVLGYDPQVYYTGRSPLEALSIGVDMEPTDVSFRCNLVTLSEEEEAYEEKRILDHSAGEISTEDANILMEALMQGMRRAGYTFYTGTSYRHLLIHKFGSLAELTPPHDILTKQIGTYLPQDPVLREMMETSYQILNEHPLNQERRKKGLNPANSVWFWGAGTRPVLTSFEEIYQKKGAMISAVDLLKGIAVGAGLYNITVEGATEDFIRIIWEKQKRQWMLWQQRTMILYMCILKHQTKWDTREARQIRSGRSSRLISRSLGRSQENWKIFGWTFGC